MRNYQTAGILPESRRRTRNTSMFTLINCGGKKKIVSYLIQHNEYTESYNKYRAFC